MWVPFLKGLSLTLFSFHRNGSCHSLAGSWPPLSLPNSYVFMSSSDPSSHLSVQHSNCLPQRRCGWSPQSTSHLVWTTSSLPNAFFLPEFPDSVSHPALLRPLGLFLPGTCMPSVARCHQWNSLVSLTSTPSAAPVQALTAPASAVAQLMIPRVLLLRTYLTVRDTELPKAWS